MKFSFIASWCLLSSCFSDGNEVRLQINKLFFTGPSFVYSFLLERLQSHMLIKFKVQVFHCLIHKMSHPRDHH